MSPTSLRILLAGALLPALLLLATPAAAQPTPEPGTPPADTTEITGTAALTPTLPLSDTAALDLFERDLGSSTAPIDDTAPVTDTLLAALADFLTIEKSAPQDTALADVFGSAIPERSKAAGLAVYLPLVATAAQPQSGQVEPPPAEPPAKGANVTVVAWPTPSIRVARDGILSYELRLYNDGAGSASGTKVTLAFDPAQLTPIGSDLDRGAGDWVSEVRSNAVVVSFGKLGDKQSRVGYVYFRVGRFLADNTVLSVRPAYTWSDARGTSERSGNWAPVLVGGGNDGGAYVWMIVQPVSGLPGELRTFYSNRFAPGETVTAWLNAPGGVVALNLTETADEVGQVWLDYRPSRLAPGTYQLVVYGNRSRLVGVATFVVW